MNEFDDANFADDLFIKTRVLFASLFQVRLGFLDGMNRIATIVHAVMNINVCFGVETFYKKNSFRKSSFEINPKLAVKIGIIFRTEYLLLKY